jgi:hypothetical protein
MGSFYASVLQKYKNENSQIFQNIFSKSYGRTFPVNNFLNIFLNWSKLMSQNIRFVTGRKFSFFHQIFKNKICPELLEDNWSKLVAL